MLTLAGDRLTVSVLEPDADEARLGSRYCAGGYVWQVTDARHGPIFAGPRFPAADPPPFDGQGAPEVFELGLGQDRARVGDEVYVIGVGRVRRESPVRPFHVRDNPRVSERAAWTLDSAPSSLVFHTTATFGDFALALTRTLVLQGRTLRSTTRLQNRGAGELPVRWFAHPFFPWAGERWCRLSLESALPDGAPLEEDAEGFLRRARGTSWERGHYVVPRVALGGHLRVEQCHPKLGLVHVACDFPLGGLALWGNERTASFEPFFQTILLAGTATSWSLSYEF